MNHDPLVFIIFLVFTGASVLATIALYARQAMLVAYIVLGVLVGPSGFALVPDPSMVEDIAHVGIMFLLFLLGLNLPPDKLWKLMRETTVVTVVSSLGFALLGVGLAWVFGFTSIECLVIGAALMFSSTIIGLKLLPTTVLHHKHTGGVIISILLLQDLIAIVLLLLLRGGDPGGGSMVMELGRLAMGLVLLLLCAFLFERYVLLRLIRRFNKIQEYIFLVAIGWCLGIAELANVLGLSHETGAFIAGVALATNPVSLYIAESLKPLRDFFLVLFFFSLGARFDLPVLADVWLPALLLAGLAILCKPLMFRTLLGVAGEDRKVASEVGVRLGQISEFSLIIALVAAEAGLIGMQASYLIQVATIITFIASSYWIVMRYPTPIAVSDRLRRD